MPDPVLSAESSINGNQGQTEFKKLTLITRCHATSGIPVCSAGRGAELGQKKRR